MPRAKVTIEETAEQEVPKKRAPRKRVARAVSSPAVEVDGEVRTRRKAPAVVTSPTVRTTSTKKKRVLIPLGVLCVGFGASALIGISDAGQINVGQIATQQEMMVRDAVTGEEVSVPVTIPVQNTSLPDGGLVASGAVPPPDPTPVATSSLATTTDVAIESASSTTASSTDVTEVAPAVPSVDDEVTPPLTE